MENKEQCKKHHNIKANGDN